jgi:peptidoglycan L-alanyl-D-glutamate endopeptidase CwlK
MAYQLSPRSIRIRAELHPELQRLIDELINHVDFSVTEGHRGTFAQQAAFDAGLSRAKPGQSKHNLLPAEAVHLIPYPMPEPASKDVPGSVEREWREYAYFAGAVNLCASMLGIKLRWGGDWNDNWRTVDNRFNDLQHHEIF